jgi:peroxiredoxin Q/BCP
LRDTFAEYEQRGIQIVAIYGQGFGAVRKFAEKEKLPFPVLIDEDRSVIRAYGVYVRINFESWNTARPSTVLIDSAGIVRFVFVGKNQLEWPTHAMVFAALAGGAAG